MNPSGLRIGTPALTTRGFVEEDMREVARIIATALAFTDKVGEQAEEEGHHPTLLTEWGRATVTWWTHKIGELHQNDFIMAARTDELFGG